MATAGRTELKKYADAVDELLGKRLSPDAFETRFISVWGSDEVDWSNSTFGPRSFVVVGDFVDDPTLRDAQDVGPDELMIGAQRFSTTSRLCDE